MEKAPSFGSKLEEQAQGKASREGGKDAAPVKR